MMMKLWMQSEKLFCCFAMWAWILAYAMYVCGGTGEGHVMNLMSHPASAARHSCHSKQIFYQDDLHAM